MVDQLKRTVIPFIVFSLYFALAVSPTWADNFSTSETEHIEAAKGYMEASQWDYAGYEWRAVLEKNPNNLEAHIGLANTLMRSGYAQDAVNHLENLRKTTDQLPLELTYGKALEQVERYSDAGVVYVRILRKIPLEAITFQRLITLEPKLNDEEKKALKIYLNKSALEASKKGNQALKEKRYTEAAKYFSLSTSYLPNLSDINNYGVALLVLEKYDDALKQFKLLKLAQSGRWEYYANAAFAALGKGNAAEAASNMEKAISLCTDAQKKPLLYNNLGFIYESRERWEKARSAYEHAVDLNPHFSKALMNLAYVCQKDMDYTDSIATYRKLLGVEPNNVLAWNRLGFAYELAHQDRQAIDAYKQAIKAKPEDKDGYYNLSILYRKLDKEKQAEETYKRLMTLEFNQMETGKPNGTDIAGDPGKNKTRLLEYVDIFPDGQS